MNYKEYEVEAKRLYNKPPNTETPKEQKFKIGEIVKIVNPNSWFSRKSFDEDIDRLYQIEYSYYQKFGGSQERNKKEYSLKHLFEDNSSAWYDEEELELAENINLNNKT